VYANTIGTDDPARRESAFELADLFAKQARRRADDKFSQLFSNDDSAQYKTAQKVLEGRYTWFESDILDPAGEGPHMPRHEASAATKFEAAPDVAAPEVGQQAEAVQ
jgi:hypothetical protein